jgi:dihydrofolate reductase
MISLIVAISENNVIGKGNTLPWHLNSDLKYFSKTTTGHPVIMGFNTYISIDEKYRPLKNRTNIVLARNVDYDFPKEVKIASSIKQALSYIKESQEAFVIGGASIYRQFIEQDLIDKLYITRVHTQIDGDIEFPKIDLDKWTLLSKNFNKKTDKDDYDHTFLIYQKVKS